MRLIAATLTLVACSANQPAAPRALPSASVDTATVAATTPPTPSSRPQAVAPSGTMPVPPEPQCPTGTASQSFFCDGEAEPPPTIGYPPPYDRCRTSPLFSLRETDARRARGERACCQLRCFAPQPSSAPSGSPPSSFPY